MTTVLACIDGSRSAPGVCDYAAWAAQRLNAPLTLLHVLDKGQYPIQPNLSGSIGLGAREQLLEELAALDEQRARLALEQGRQLLDAAKQRVTAAGLETAATRQRHGDLVETLSELESDIRLLVMGKVGEDHSESAPLIGSHLERVIRTLQRPILITPAEFRAPQNLMVAFDGSATMRKGVDMIAASPLFRGLPCHLVAVGAETPELREQLDGARWTLEGAGFKVHSAIRSGEVESTLRAYREEQRIDLAVMGAYGHSRIRQWLIGSTTTNMIRHATVPLLVLR